MICEYGTFEKNRTITKARKNESTKFYQAERRKTRFFPRRQPQNTKVWTFFFFVFSLFRAFVIHFVLFVSTLCWLGGE